MLRWGSVALLVVAVALLALAFRHTLAQVGARVHLLSPAALVASTLATVAGTGAAVLPYRAVLADLGSPLALRPAVRVYFLGQLGKYLPGSVWPVMAQMELGRRHGVPRSRAGAAAAVTLLLSLVVALMLAALLLPLAHPGSLGRYAWVFLALPLGLVVLSPPVLTRLLGIALRLARRPALERPLSAVGIGKAAVGSAVGWLLQGTAVAVLARDLGARGAGVWALGIAAFALAWVAGFLVLVAPAGAAIREVALTALLLSVLPRASGLLVALVARLEFTAGDLVWGAAAVTAARRRGVTLGDLGETGDVAPGVDPAGAPGVDPAGARDPQ